MKIKSKPAVKTVTAKKTRTTVKKAAPKAAAKPAVKAEKKATASRSRHRYSSNGASGTFRGRTWLDGSGTTGQSWTMKVNPTNRNYLMVLYWGDEGDTRNFDIMCDDVLVASESLCHNDPGRFMMRCYPIPEEGTSGKQNVRIHLTSPSGTTTGGIFYVYMMSSPEDSTPIGDLQGQVPSRLHGGVTAFDLAGRRWSWPGSSTPNSHGIMIVDGRKVAY